MITDKIGTMKKISKINPKKTALIVIDAQNDFIHEKGKFGWAKEAKHTITPLRRLIEVCRKVGIPVVYTVVQYRDDYSDAGPLSKSRQLGALKIGSWGAEIFDELKPATKDIIVEKKRYSAFYNTNLEVILRGLGSKTLIFTGYATNVCVESTVRDARFRDFNIIVLSDVTAALSKDMHEASLINVQSFFGSVTTSRNILQMITATGGGA